MADFTWKAARKKYGVVIDNFQNGSTKGCLPLLVGERVHILEEYCTGSGESRKASWYRGYSYKNRKNKGIFPASFVHLKAFRVEDEGPYETIIPVEDEVVKETSFVLREWNTIWKRLFVENGALFEVICKVMQELFGYRRELVSDTLTLERAQEVKEQIVSRIDWGNGKLGLDLVPRREGRQVDPEQCSIIELYRLHCHSVENSKGTWPRKHTVSHKFRSSKEGRFSMMTHLLLNFKSFACNVGEESETYFSLYDTSTSEFISEKFLVRNTSQGMPLNMDKLGNYRGLFTDLSETDLEKEIYLVAQIYRRGRVLQESSSKKVPTFKYRRPWGVAVLNLKDLFRINPEEELDFHLKVQSCAESESSFPTLHETLVKKQTLNVGRSMSMDREKQTNGVAVSLKLLHGDLSCVRTDNPILFSKGIAITQRIGFSDSINPGEVRNDIYLTLRTAEFDRGSKKAAKNVEVQITVFDSEGHEIQGCISGGCGEDAVTHYFSYLFYHNNSPKWNETIRLSVPIEKFTGAHIRLEFAHCSTRDKTEKTWYGFSFLSLTDSDSTTQADGTHVLSIYKCDDPKKIKDYCKLPSFHDDFNDPRIIPHLPTNLPYNRSNKESVTVSTFLCSTKFTQQADLLGVLQWTIRQDCIEQSLRNLINLRGQDVVKYLQDILDALYNMLGSQTTERFKYSGEVFHALVRIFNLLRDSKFEKFACVVEAYLQNFAFPLVYRDLLICLQEKTEQAVSCADFDKDYTVTDVFQVLEEIFRFAAKSCLLFKSAYGNITEFKQQVYSTFVSFGRILSSSESQLRTAQIKLMRELHKLFPPLLELITVKELSELLQSLYTKIPKELNPQVQEAKAALVQETVNSVLFVEKESRSLILPVCMSLVKRCFITKMCLRGAADTLGDILHRFKGIEVSAGEIQSVMNAMFDVLMHTLLMMDELQRETAGGMMICCLMELLRIMGESHYSTLLQSYPKGRPLKDFLIRVLLIFRDLIKRDIFPTDWTAMRMVTNHVILTAIQYIAHSLTESFLTGGEFDNQLWSNYFDLAVSFVTQPSLQLEMFSVAKKDKVKDKYQDMRVVIGYQIQTLWNGLGDHKSYFIPSMIGPFLEVTMVPETDVRKATIPIFFDMMLCEQKMKGNFTSVQGEMIEKLDILITGNNGDLEYMNLFNQILLDKVQAEPVLKEDGRRFVVSVTNLLERLLDYRQVIEGEENRDKRMHCTFNILNFYKDNINREEMYIRYISKLFHLHHDANNFVEAGLTLQLYAQLLRWTHDNKSASLDYPAQKEFERKEKLYLKIIECFDKGKAWEYGIPLCKELAEVYEKKLFNYKKLSEVLQRQAVFFNNILEGQNQRQNPSYYRVAYYGMTFPPFVRNKEFVYRGDECLRLSTIMSHLSTEFPTATILSTNSPPDDTMREGDAQYIQISSVKPVAAERSEFEGYEVPMEISNFYEVNEIDTFQFDRPYHREERDKNNEFKTLCLERRILKTNYKLPGILRWYEVTQSEVIHLSPIMVAMENIRSVNKELEYLITRSKCNTDMYFKNLTMRLQGVISANVSGGIPKYQEAFFSDEYSSKYPEELINLMDLKCQLVEQLDMMERGLKVMGELASDDLKPLHKSQVEIFVKLRQGVTDTGSPRPGRIRTPVRPGTPGSSSLQSSSSNRSSITSAEAISSDPDNIYMEPPEDPLVPPPPPEKRRSGSRLLSYMEGPGGCMGPGPGPCVGPPIPTRPSSAHITGSTLQQLTNRLQQSRGVTGSDTALNQQSAHKALATSMSSLNLGSGGSRSPDDHNLRRYTSTPDTTTSDPSTPPPLPQRKASESASILNTRPPPPPPRHSTNDTRFLSYNVPSPTASSTSEDRPAIPTRTKTMSIMNGNFDHNLTSVKEDTTSEAVEPTVTPVAVTTVNAPPLPPRIPPRPSIPPLPSAPVVVYQRDPTTTPPPIPRRTSQYGRAPSQEDTKM